MSELSATNCGCDRNDGCFGGNNSCIWIILLLLCCCDGFGSGNGRGGYGCGNNSCIWIIILLFCCGGLGSGNDCC